MNLRLLRYFMACVENRTMHAAAQAVHISQPALSKAIAELEADLGVTLLDRMPRGVAPTPYGETLFRYAKMIDSDVRRAIAEIDAMRGATRGRIVVGVIPTMASLVGEVARNALGLHPGLHLNLRVGFSVDLLPALFKGELDMALVLLPGTEPPPGLTFEPLIQTRPIVVVRKGHPLSRRSRLSLQELSEHPWLIPDFPASHKESVHRAYLDAGLPPPNASINVSTVVLFGQLVSQSDLVSVVPSMLLDVGADSGLTALSTDFSFLPEQVGLAFQDRSVLLPGARVVMNLIRDACAGVGERRS